MNRKQQEAERIFENLQWQAKRVAKHTMGVDVLIGTIRDYARYQYELLEWYVRKVWGDKTFHVRRGALISTIEGLLEDGEKARRRLLNFLFGVQSLSNHKNRKARAHVAILWAVLQPSFVRGEDGKVNTAISLDAMTVLCLLDEEARIDERCRAECEEQPKLEEWEIPDNDSVGDKEVIDKLLQMLDAEASRYLHYGLPLEDEDDKKRLREIVREWLTNLLAHNQKEV